MLLCISQSLGGNAAHAGAVGALGCCGDDDGPPCCADVLILASVKSTTRHYVDCALCVLTSAAAAKQNSGIEDITHPGQAQRGVSLRQWLFWKKRAPQAKIKVTFQVIIGKNYIPIVSKQINPTTTENHLQENKLTMMPPTRLLSTFVSSSSMRVTAQQYRSLSSQSNVAAQKLKNALEEYRRLQ